MDENIFEIKKIEKINNNISPEMGSLKNEECIIIEALKAKFLKLQDRLTKMGKDIKDIEKRLHINN